jgi:hypothetical protein
MNLAFYSVTGGMMSETLIAIISKFVTKKRLIVNQTMLITAYFEILFSDAVSCYKENTASVVCE